MNIGRIIEEYSTPAPSNKNAVIKTISGVSKIHNSGVDSYHTSLRIIFPDKITLNDFLFLSPGNKVKYYDERGNIFLGVVEGKPECKRINTKYDTKFNLILTKKDILDIPLANQFTDLYTPQLTIIEPYQKNSAIHVTYSSNILLTFTGINQTLTLNTAGKTLNNNELILLLKRDAITQLRAYYEIRERIKSIEDPNTHKIVYYSQLEFVPILDSSFGNITCNNPTAFYITNTGGNHYAFDYIDRMSRSGLVTQVDANNNLIYTFRPSAYLTRAEFLAFMNRTRKYIDKSIRGG